MNYRFKHLKKAIGISLVLVLAIGIVPFLGSKAYGLQGLISNITNMQNKFMVTIGNVQGAVGDTVEVPVSISNPGGGIASYGMQINFDPAVLEITDITSKQGDVSSFWSNFDNTVGYLRSAWVDTTGGDKVINTATELFSIKLKIKSNNLGDKALTIDTSSPNNLIFTNSDGGSLGTNFTEGKVTVVKGDAQLVSEAKSALELGYAYGDSAVSVKKDLTLKTSNDNGVLVSWVSSKPEIINAQGKVLRPSYAAGDASVTLTATIVKNNTTETKEFNVKVVKNDPSTNAVLKALNISNGALSPVFNSNTLKYTVDVAKDVASITVTPTLADSLSTLTVNGKTSQEPIALNIGTNNIKVVVTAQDGVTKKQYELVINRSDIKTEEIKADVETGSIANGSAVSQTIINRSTTSDGVVKDKVTLTQDSAKEAVKKAVDNGFDNVRISIPDAKDTVSEVYVGTPKEAISEIAKGKLNFEVYTENARILVPNSSLTNFTDDLYFRVVPIKQAEEIKSVQDRVQAASEIKAFAKSSSVEVIGRPMTIETNMENRTVTLVLPLPDSISKDEKNLAVYVEHHDGTKELVKGTIVTYKGNKLGLQFTVNKFSTFTLVRGEGLAQVTNDNLPKTGGVATRDYMVVGLFIILAGGVMIVANRRKGIKR
ncbi:cadherin-like beta sandwich domain-containing protein [Clostridium sp. YIM B02505]|uniref:Cadherin-like beta sandwich domain-containing protein n=1 Tax=Clostridium yunnanense TaxID=2800325 RepID=A0ABS1EKF3_9CLOT|nr:immunoglobulin-like domain-containing protein [Clostridium yunnanense]MBK1809815.1 cadherin-like beta sandwich domain-containing protein [Clostridium yunnanense]